MISSTNDKAMRVLSHGVLLLIAVLALVPFVLLVIASFTQNSVALTEGYSFFPSALPTVTGTMWEASAGLTGCMFTRRILTRCVR